MQKKIIELVFLIVILGYATGRYETVNPMFFQPVIEYAYKDLDRKLSRFQFHVTQHGYMENPFSGKYLDFFNEGTYHCIICNSPVFKSEHKYESDEPYAAFHTSTENVIKVEFKMWVVANTILLRCKNCGSKLGRMFENGPPSRGHLRYSINSSAINFIPTENPSEFVTYESYKHDGVSDLVNPFEHPDYDNPQGSNENQNAIDASEDDY